MLVLRKASEVH